MAINLTIDQKGIGLLQRRSQAVARQLPFATSVALNNTAFDARTALNGATRGYFDRPTKFTQTAFLVQKSKKADLTAYVYANNQPGRSRSRYLRYPIQGGQRRQKGFERFFLGAPNDGTIPPGSVFVPTRNVKLTASGNVSISTLKSINKGLSGSPRGGFFIGTPRGGNRPPGIYRRSREQLFAYFIAQPAPRYDRRFPIQDVGSKVIQRKFNGYLRSALERALATAR
jgi:hypothetical protein